ncbi:MAG: TCP-1/cpn60 chaperonin family protein [Candidatus Heimdallarchaeota archaeon]|nr:TCP-1/cpn60 chaperonin family protein [Candidatus Heimdallarchaeota archaeon]
MSLTSQPVIILREGSERTQGRDALRNNISAAKIIAETVKSALGPRGMDKMLIDSFGDITITNDGATILKEIDVQHPGSKFIIDLAKTQDEETGDGTTTVVVLAGELLKNAEELIELNVHPSIIVEGYRLSMDKSLELLNDVAIEVGSEDRTQLIQAAITSMSSKVINNERDIMSDVIVDAALKVLDENKVDIDNIVVIKKQGGSLSETTLIDGMVLDKEVVHSDMPKSIKTAKILLLNTALETVKTEFDSKLNIDSPEQVQKFLDREQAALKEMSDKIVATGANVVFCQKGIDDMVQHFLAKAGVMAIRRVKKSDMTKLSNSTGAPIISNLTDLSANDVGKAKKVEELTLADDKLIYITGTPKTKTVTIIIRGGTEFVLDEYERSMHDALCVVRNVLEDQKLVPGGGAPELYIANELRKFKLDKPSKIQLAIEAFAKSMEVIPRTLAENAGHDPIDMIGQLNNKYKEGKNYFGVSAESSEIQDMQKLGVMEPVRVKYQAISSAAEAATMLLRIDDVVAVKATNAGAGGMPPMDDY